MTGEGSDVARWLADHGVAAFVLKYRLNATPRDDRAFLGALILLAAALHKRWHHGSPNHRNYHKAARYLDALPAHYGGVDLSRLRAEVWAALHDPALRPRVLP